MSSLVAIGTVIKPWGKVIAVGLTGGERYYWLDDNGVISMMPACEIEDTPEDNTWRPHPGVARA